MVKSDSNGGSIFDRIDRIYPTKYQQFDTGNSSLTSPPRPAAAKSDKENSFLFNINILTYRDYILQASTWSINKKSRSLKRKESKASANISTASSQYFDSPPASETFSTFYDTSTGSMKPGRKPETPFNENFMGTSMKVISIIKSIHEHGKTCPGNIIIRRNSVLLKRLSLKVTINCTEKNKCAAWENGVYKWLSSGQIIIPNTSRMVCVPDVLYSLATYITPTTKAHAEQFLTSMLLTPPSRNLLNELVTKFVKPYLLGEKEKIISARCEELRNLGEDLIINMDVGYTGARKAQCATIMVGSGSRAVFSRTDTENGAWLKEGILVSLALDEAINIRKLDVVAVEIDDNAANKKK